jgi:hypothetical protein
MALVALPGKHILRASFFFNTSWLKNKNMNMITSLMTILKTRRRWHGIENISEHA